MLTVDALVEGVHFEPGWLSARQIGRKSFLVNASDIAAMGGRPRWCLVSIAVPPRYAVRDLFAVQAGITAAARACGATVVGDNLTAAEQLAVSISLVGEAPRRITTRAGARPGDYVCVTGTLGDAAAGLRQLRRGGHNGAALVRRFAEPRPRLRAGQKLVQAGIVSAMIDVSDGLLQDLGHVVGASGVGAVVEVDRLPLSPAYRKALGADATLALRGGEDYELLCTVPERKLTVLERIRRELGCPLRCIGRITAGRGVRVVDRSGDVLRLESAGFDHFRSRR